MCNGSACPFLPFTVRAAAKITPSPKPYDDLKSPCCKSEQKVLTRVYTTGYSATNFLVFCEQSLWKGFGVLWHFKKSPRRIRYASFVSLSLSVDIHNSAGVSFVHFLEENVTGRFIGPKLRKITTETSLKVYHQGKLRNLNFDKQN